MGAVVEMPQTLPATVERVTDTMVGEALRATGGNRSQAARVLGIKRTTLVEMLRRRPILESLDRVILVRVVGPQPRKLTIQIED